MAYLSKMLRVRCPASCIATRSGKPHSLAREVDLSPTERQHLAWHAPSGDVGERDRGADLFWKPASDCLKLVGLKEASPWCCFTQHRDVRTGEELAGLNRQGEGALQDGEFAVDGAVAGGLALPVCHVLP